MNKKSRITNSINNISTGVIAQIVQMLLGFVSRTIFVKYLAIEYLGVNSLFSNVLSMLSLAELGLGSAFIYSLYKPLASGNKVEIATIIKFYKKTYLFVGLFIFISGVALIPFLKDIIPVKPVKIVEDIRLIYIIYLFNTSVTYLFSYKITLLDADQKISEATKNSIKFSIVQILLQIAVLVLFQNFIYYLLVQTVMQFSSNWYVSKIVDKQYPFLAENNHLKIDKSVKNKILKNVKATFLTKIGGVLVNGTDNLFINYFVGLAILGKYSNYLLLMSLVSSFVMIIFANLRSSIANYLTKESLEKQREIFKLLNFLNFWIFGVCAVIFIFSVEDFIKIWIGKTFILSFFITGIMAINFFMMGMQNSFWTFKSAYGFFNEGKYMVLLTAFLNLILSYFLGLHFGILGILMATALARLITNFWYDPFIVLKKGLQQNPFHYLKRFSAYIFSLALSCTILYFITENIQISSVSGLIIKFLLSFFVTNAIIYVVFRKSDEIKQSKVLISNIFASAKTNFIKK